MQYKGSKAQGRDLNPGSPEYEAPLLPNGRLVEVNNRFLSRYEILHK
jgi:hypothetical protein